MWWSRSHEPDPRLDELVELLQGIARLLMGIDSKLERVQTLLEDE
jgi:hypothetical protein